MEAAREIHSAHRSPHIPRTRYRRASPPSKGSIGRLWAIPSTRLAWAKAVPPAPKALAVSQLSQLTAGPANETRACRQFDK